MGLTVAKKAVIKRTEQAHRSRVRNPFPLPPLPAHIGAPSSNPAHIDTYRAPTHTSLHLRNTTQSVACLLPIAGPQSLRSAREVRHVSSPQGVSQHEQAGSGGSGAETGVAGALGMHMHMHMLHAHAHVPSLVRVAQPARLYRLRKVWSYLIAIHMPHSTA